MITIKEPIHLNSLSHVCKTEDDFAGKIMANYELFPLHFTPEQLLFLLKGQEEETVNTTEITQLVNNETVNNNITLNINVLNKFINRAMALIDNDYTYRDLIYVSSFLEKCGIKNVKEFLTNMSEYISETKQVIKENKLFEENTELIKKFSEEAYLYSHNKNLENKEELTNENIVNTFASAILKKLSVAENTEYISQSARAVSVSSDYSRVIQNLSFIKMNEYAGYMQQNLYDYGSSTYEYLHVNPYELSILNNTDSSTVMENIIASVLLNITDDLCVLNSKSGVESSSFAVDSYSNFTEQISDSVMRFIAYHSAPMYKDSVYLSKYKREQHLKKLKAVEQFVWEVKNEITDMTEKLYDMVSVQNDTHIDDRSEQIDLINRVYEDYVSQQLIERKASESEEVNNHNINDYTEIKDIAGADNSSLNISTSSSEFSDALEIINRGDINNTDNNISNISKEESVEELKLINIKNTNEDIQNLSESVTEKVAELINSINPEISNNNISESTTEKITETTDNSRTEILNENINANESLDILDITNADSISNTDNNIQNINKAESVEILEIINEKNINDTDSSILNVSKEESVEELTLINIKNEDEDIQNLSESVTEKVAELINNINPEISNNNISESTTEKITETTDNSRTEILNENINANESLDILDITNADSISNTDNNIQNINKAESVEILEIINEKNINGTDSNILNVSAEEPVEELKLINIKNTDEDIQNISESVTEKVTELINNINSEISNESISKSTTAKVTETTDNRNTEVLNENINAYESLEALEIINERNTNNIDSNVQNTNVEESVEELELVNLKNTDEDIQNISESVTKKVAELINNQNTEITNENISSTADTEFKFINKSSEENYKEENIKNIQELLGTVNMKVDMKRAMKESLLAIENQELVLKQVNDAHTDVSQYREELKNSLYEQVSEETREILEKAELYMKDPQKAEELGITGVDDINEINSILNEYYNDVQQAQISSSAYLEDVKLVDIQNAENIHTADLETSEINKKISTNNTTADSLNIQTEEFNTRYIQKMYEILNNLIKHSVSNEKNLYDDGGEIVNIIQHIVNEQNNVSMDNVIETAVYNYSQQHMEDKFTHIIENIKDSDFTYDESAVFNKEELGAVINFAEEHSLYFKEDINSYKTTQALIYQAENTSFNALNFIYDRDEKEGSDTQKSDAGSVKVLEKTENTSVNNSVAYDFNEENVSEHTDSVNISEYSSSVTNRDEKKYYENLQKNIETVIDRQISNISERVYSRLEKKMSNERKRRGY
jgi:hypothetical protein